MLICPLCAKGVWLAPNQDANITWDVHVNTNCDPSNYQKATKKRRCPVPGCKELLTFTNTIRCRDCTREHCLKHRFGPDHKCPGPKKPDSSFPCMGMLKSPQKGMSAAPNRTCSGGASSWWSSSLLKAASRLSTATNQALQKARDGMAQSSGDSSSGLGAQCLQCPARFPTFNALVDHVQKSHRQRGQPTSGRAQRVTVGVFPKCSRAFRDLVMLVEHVEWDHVGSSRA